VVLLVAVGAAASLAAAPLAAADSSNDCQSSAGVTVCAQGAVTGAGGGQSVVAPGAGGIPPYSGGECTTPYGTYQNCIVQQGIIPPASRR